MKRTISLYATALTLCLLTLEIANAQAIYYEVQLDIFENDKRIASPYVVIEAGKTGTVTSTNSSGDELYIDILASYEGVLDGQSLVSLSLNLSSQKGVAKLEKPSAGRTDEQVESLMASTIFVKSTEAIHDPATLSKGDIDVVASVRRVPVSELKEDWTNNVASDDPYSNVAGVANGEASILSSSCCEADCNDGGPPLKCCDVVKCCCGGDCCKPKPKVGF